ncbi:MAG TPA: TetR family transcriptional regulator [Burkholderiales bacterium]|jgi:TetR/AcrR family transcriptional regulator, acrAB operon repressor|nr:TetR family transcriptional regulator [Burkholderiales bacterium]
MRRTKEEAEQTRRRIMAAALKTFQAKGIARTTLEQVAVAAGVTRGAVYWHFADKRSLVRAIREDVTLPLLDQSDFVLLQEEAAQPLERIERFLLHFIELLERDPRTRATLHVMSYKCEYVEEMARELQTFRKRHVGMRAHLAQVYTEARANGSLRKGVDPKLAAAETLVFLVGLLRLWLLEGQAQGTRSMARQLVAAHVDGRRAD